MSVVEQSKDKGEVSEKGGRGKKGERGRKRDERISSRWTGIEAS